MWVLCLSYYSVFHRINWLSRGEFMPLVLNTKHDFIREMILRSNFMRSKFNFFRRSNFWSWGRIHEIKFFFIFHEVKIPNNWFDLLITPFFMRSKFKKSIIRQFQSHDRFVSYKYDHEVEIQKSIIRNFDLMINLLVTSTIMRSKFKIN
jgi:hypothetical protein